MLVYCGTVPYLQSSVGQGRQRNGEPALTPCSDFSNQFSTAIVRFCSDCDVTIFLAPKHVRKRNSLPEFLAL